MLILLEPPRRPARRSGIAAAIHTQPTLRLPGLVLGLLLLREVHLLTPALHVLFQQDTAASDPERTYRLCADDIRKAFPDVLVRPLVSIM